MKIPAAHPRQYTLSQTLLTSTNVVSLDLFGSAASREFSTSILLSRLQSFLKGIFDAYMDLAEGLEALFGRKVDLITERSIRNPYFRKAVEACRIRIYDRYKYNIRK